MLIPLRNQMKACIPSMLYCTTMNMTEIFLMWYEGDMNYKSLREETTNLMQYTVCMNMK